MQQQKQKQEQKQQQQQQQQSSTVEIINFYADMTKHRIKDVEEIANPSDPTRNYKLWVYADDFENKLGVMEERLHYLMIKKRWNDRYSWSDGKARKFGKLGITIPYVVYEFIQSRKNLIHELVVCIIKDVNRWKYTKIEPYHFYRISFLDMHEFAKKNYTVFVNEWKYERDGELHTVTTEVIGFPYSLFSKI